MSYCTGITDEGMTALAHHPSLNALDVSHTEIELEDVSWVNTLQCLKYVALGVQPTPAFEYRPLSWDLAQPQPGFFDRFRTRRGVRNCTCHTSYCV